MSRDALVPYSAICYFVLREAIPLLLGLLLIIWMAPYGIYLQSWRQFIHSFRSAIAQQSMEDIDLYESIGDLEFEPDFKLEKQNSSGETRRGTRVHLNVNIKI